MRAAHIRGVSRRRGFVVTTRRDPAQPVAPDLVKRQFTAAGPNQLWVADMTYGTPNQRSPPSWGWSCLSMFGMQRSPELMLQ
jgi:transposase InsO family protein